MKHLIFPSAAEADAFAAELQARGLVQAERGQAPLNPPPTTPPRRPVEGADGEHHDNANGAVVGTGVGLAVGAVTGALATIVTGGAAVVPVLLGMAALGSGIGAGVGAMGGPTIGSHDTDAIFTDEHHGHAAAGRLIAVDDTVPADAVDEVAARHGGRRA